MLTGLALRSVGRSSCHVSHVLSPVVSAQLLVLFSTAPMEERFSACMDIIDYDENQSVTLDEMVPQSGCCTLTLRGRVLT